MNVTTEHIGTLIKETRKSQGLTQADLALACGTGLRFIIELEKGKESCQFGKVLHVLQTLGIEMNFTPPAINNIGG